MNSMTKLVLSAALSLLTFVAATPRSAHAVCPIASTVMMQQTPDPTGNPGIMNYTVQKIFTVSHVCRNTLAFYAD